MSEISENKNEQEKAPSTVKRVAAVIGIVLLVGLYLLTLRCRSFCGSSAGA